MDAADDSCNCARVRIEDLFNAEEKNDDDDNELVNQSCSTE